MEPVLARPPSASYRLQRFSSATARVSERRRGRARVDRRHRRQRAPSRAGPRGPSASPVRNATPRPPPAAPRRWPGPMRSGGRSRRRLCSRSCSGISAPELKNSAGLSSSMPWARRPIGLLRRARSARPHRHRARSPSEGAHPDRRDAARSGALPGGRPPLSPRPMVAPRRSPPATRATATCFSSGRRRSIGSASWPDAAAMRPPNASG